MLRLLTLLVALALIVPVAAATADTKTDMIAIMDKLGENKPGNEALVDWDHLIINTPQTKNMNIQKMYAEMDANKKKAFRTSFLSSYASSFQRTANGHKFSDAAKMKGMLTVNDKGDHPTMVLNEKSGKGNLKVFFTRKGKTLLFQGMEKA